MHPVTVYWCRVHGIHFTVYPPGFLPFGRVRTLPREGQEEDPGASMISGAIAVRRGRWISEELIEDEVGPVRRTVIRRATKVAVWLGLDEPEVASEILSALDLGGLRMRHDGSRRQRILHRVAELEGLSDAPDGWSRMLKAMSVAGRVPGIFVIDGLRQGRTIDMRSLAASSLHGPPQVPGRSDDFVLEESRPGP